MSEYVVVSDIHGNYPALQAVVDKEGTDKQYIVLGDIHGLNAYPKETLDLVREIGDYTLAGNHDKAIFEHGEGHVVSDKLSAFELRHTLQSLSKEDVLWMLRLPHMHVFSDSGERIALTHAFPWPEQASGYEAGNAGVLKGDVPRVAKVVSDDYDWVLHGHTHTQYELDCSRFAGDHDVHFVNPGSLGYDSTYAVVDFETGDVSLREVEVDTWMVTEHIQDALPEGAPPVSEWY